MARPMIMEHLFPQSWCVAPFWMIHHELGLRLIGLMDDLLDILGAA